MFLEWHLVHNSVQWMCEGWRRSPEEKTLHKLFLKPPVDFSLKWLFSLGSKIVTQLQIPLKKQESLSISSKSSKQLTG